MALKRAGSSDLTVMQGSGYHQKIIRLSSERQPLSRGIHLLRAIAKEQIIFSHVRFLFCSIFPPRTNICIEYSSTSVTCIKIS